MCHGVGTVNLALFAGVRVWGVVDLRIENFEDISICDVRTCDF